MKLDLKRFNHIPLDDFGVAERVETDTMRLYRTPQGNLYPSVTTVLSIMDKTELVAWQQAVGLEEADRVAKRASLRGTLLHDMAESYLNNTFEVKGSNPMILNDFLPIKKILDERVDNIRATEKQMWSDKLKSAGTMDLFAEYEGELSILDFKTSRRIKYEDEILGYFIQESAYTAMVAERVGIWVPNIVTIMMVDGDQNALVFKKKSIDYIDKYIKLRREYELKNGI